MTVKSDSLQQKILDDIRNGILQPGKPIPSRNQLCRKYQFSRTTVDRAIRRLIAGGYLSAVQGSRTIVRPGGPDNPLERLFIIYPSAQNTPGFGDQFFKQVNCPLPVTAINEEDAGVYFARMCMPGTAVIWNCPGLESLYFMKSLRNAGIPQILINRDFAGYNYVATDQRASIREGLAWLLIEAGRDITLLTRPSQTTRPYMGERTIAFYESAVELGARLSGSRIHCRDIHDIPQEIAAVAQELFLGVKPARGIVLLNQEFAIPLVTCGVALGKRPGRDYFLLTFDYYDELKGYPGLGMLRQQFDLMRSEAYRWISGGYAERGEPFQVKLKAEFIVNPEN